MIFQTNRQEKQHTRPYVLRLSIARKTSGAIHRGVPTQTSGGAIPLWAIQHVCKRDLSGTALSKSQSFTKGMPSALLLSKSIKIFSLFMSRWIISLEWISANAHATSRAIHNAISTGTCFSPVFDNSST